MDVSLDFVRSSLIGVTVLGKHRATISCTGHKFMQTGSGLIGRVKVLGKS